MSISAKEVHRSQVWFGLACSFKDISNPDGLFNDETSFTCYHLISSNKFSLSRCHFFLLLFYLLQIIYLHAGIWRLRWLGPENTPTASLQRGKTGLQRVSCGTIGWGCRIYWLVLCRYLITRRRVTFIWHNTIRWWGSSLGALGNVEYLFIIIIIPWSNLTRSGNTW